MPKSLYSMCINHPNIDAAARCKQCGKPVCNNCKVTGPQGYYCSEECKERHQAFTERVEQMDKRELPKGIWIIKIRRILGRLVMLAIVAVFAAFAAHAMGFEIPIVGGLVEQALEFLPGAREPAR